MLSSQMVVWWLFYLSNKLKKKHLTNKSKVLNSHEVQFMRIYHPWKYPFFCPGFHGFSQPARYENSRNPVMCYTPWSLTIQFPPDSLTPSSQSREGVLLQPSFFDAVLLLIFRGWKKYLLLIKEILHLFISRTFLPLNGSVSQGIRRTINSLHCKSIPLRKPETTRETTEFTQVD